MAAPPRRAGRDALIVESPAARRVLNVPVHVNSYNLTQELSTGEDARFCRPRPVDAERVRAVFAALYRACPAHVRAEADRVKLVLGRLLLGPVAVPCYCDEWVTAGEEEDDDGAAARLLREHLAETAQFCRGPLLYVHRRCRCAGGGAQRPLAFSVMEGHVATHVFRGLLSLAEWNCQLPGLFCPCVVGGAAAAATERYALACLPRDLSLHMDDYPYLMVEIGRVLGVSEVDDYVGALSGYLGEAAAPRIQVHYKLLFGLNVRPQAPCALSATGDFFLLELQKLWLGVEYHNEVTAEFFGRVLAQLHRERGRVMMALRLPEQTVCHLSAFVLSRFKRQVLYFKLQVSYGKYKHAHASGLHPNLLCYRRLSVTFADTDTVWRNLFYVYYELSRDVSAGASAAPGEQKGKKTATKEEEGEQEEKNGESRGHHGEDDDEDEEYQRRHRLSSSGHGVGGRGRTQLLVAPPPPVTSLSGRSHDVAISVPPSSTSRLLGGGGGPLDAVAATAARAGSGRRGGAAAGKGQRDPSADRIRRYVCIISRLMFARYGERGRRQRQRRDGDADGSGAFDFTGQNLRRAYQEHRRRRHLAVQRFAPCRRKLIGGMEFAEVTGVSLDRIAVNAFNTNRVINMKAALSASSASCAGCCRLNRLPKNMTHSFVMYKHTFKEPACTVSTFVSNDAVYLNSLNVNIRGSYLEFLYSLGVYRLHVNIDHFFLPAVVCNSNSSLDVHGLEDQAVIRSERSRVYWTTNFPCMISHTNNVNVGWFKAATAIVPRVSGSDLEAILLKELSCIKNMRDVCIDYGLHRVFTQLELRNSYQIPFLSKQLILFIRVCLLKLHGREKRLYLDRLVFEAAQRGLFDYSKNLTAHTKIKHTCALIGSRLANNVPKILARNKKVKLDHLGRNANLLTVCRHVEANKISRVRLRVLVEVLSTLQGISGTPHTREVIRQTLFRLCGDAAGSGGGLFGASGQPSSETAVGADVIFASGLTSSSPPPPPSVPPSSPVDTRR
ncbi:protein UL87 [Panine betaherpesvirus 2]|uniref:Protein UL87 n=1 Tax=Panine betaherpesvirus 2 TaxID=188763 RepID=Q8QS12_9BETA|nr:protein UL87 [Panine betaherpesvirus 2]AAM00726.1 protein UL87 [Panine betaherpesvirus 2]QXV67836.1 protein UL87 [Panine betaherpesvirus 2]